MNSTEIVPGAVFPIKSGNSYRVVERVSSDGMVTWYNDCISSRLCTKAQFQKACASALSLEEIAAKGINPSARPGFFGALGGI